METIGAARSNQLGESEPVSGLKSDALSRSGKTVLRIHSTLGQKATPETKQIQQEVQKKIEHIAQALEEYVKSMQTSLRIQVNNETGRVVVTVISEDDGKTIRQIPADEMLNLASKMDEMIGVLFNEKV